MIVVNKMLKDISTIIKSIFKTRPPDGIVWLQWTRTIIGISNEEEGWKEVWIEKETDDMYKVMFLDRRFPDMWTEKELLKQISSGTFQ